MRKRSYKGESDESAKRSRAGHKAWLTQRKRYTDQEISARQSAAARKAWATMRAR